MSINVAPFILEIAIHDAPLRKRFQKSGEQLDTSRKSAYSEKNKERNKVNCPR